MNTEPQKKRRWYNNLEDAYRITARTYSWIGWLMAGEVIVAIALGILIGALTKGWITWILLGLFTGVLAATTTLSLLVRRAMYAQIDGTLGQVYAVTSQIKRGWIVSERPVAMTPDQDLVWRLVGRPGVVLISEGPSSRVRALLDQERRKINRVAQNVPITVFQVGHENGQIQLAELERKLNKLKKTLTSEEVPAIHQRLAALDRSVAPIPKGVDPMRARPNRRALRGR